MNCVYNAVFTPEEVGGYSVVVPDLPGCFSQGETLCDSVKNITEAMTLYIEDCLASREDIPAPAPLTVGRSEDTGALTFPVGVQIAPEDISVGDPYLTTAEAGELLGVNASRIRQLLLEGKLESRKKGRDHQIARWSIDAYRKEHKKHAELVRG